MENVSLIKHSIYPVHAINTVLYNIRTDHHQLCNYWNTTESKLDNRDNRDSIVIIGVEGTIKTLSDRHRVGEFVLSDCESWLSFQVYILSAKDPRWSVTDIIGIFFWKLRLQ